MKIEKTRQFLPAGIRLVPGIQTVHRPYRVRADHQAVVIAVHQIPPRCKQLTLAVDDRVRPMPPGVARGELRLHVRAAVEHTFDLRRLEHRAGVRPQYAGLRVRAAQAQGVVGARKLCVQEYRDFELGGQPEQAGDHRVFPVADETADHVDLTDSGVTSRLECPAHAFEQVRVVMPAGPFAGDPVDAIDRADDLGCQFLQFECEFGRGTGDHRQAYILFVEDLHGLGRRDHLFLVPFPVQVDVGNEWILIRSGAQAEHRQEWQDAES